MEDSANSDFAPAVFDFFTSDEAVDVTGEDVLFGGYTENTVKKIIYSSGDKFIFQFKNLYSASRFSITFFFFDILSKRFIVRGFEWLKICKAFIKIKLIEIKVFIYFKRSI